MDTKVITYQNFKNEDICCVLRDRNGEGRIEAKRQWLQGVFEDGLVLRKTDIPGKAFIEYVPAIDAWYPVDAEDYFFIHCYRLDDKYKGQGYDKALWQEMLTEARIKHKIGFCTVVGKTDMPYLNRKEDFIKKGFKLADEAPPYFQLLYRPLQKDAPVPRFMEDLSERKPEEDGFVLYYTHQCPHVAKAVPLLIAVADECGVILNTHSPEKARDARLQPAVYNTFSLFYNKEFITHQVLTSSQFKKIIMTKKTTV